MQIDINLHSEVQSEKANTPLPGTICSPLKDDHKATIETAKNVDYSQCPAEMAITGASYRINAQDIGDSSIKIGMSL
jgi:hypothetical protein